MLGHSWPSTFHEHLEQTLPRLGLPGGGQALAGEAGSVRSVLPPMAPLPLNLEAIRSGCLRYIKSMHWYFIRQQNGPAIDAARAHDMGLFVIKPHKGATCIALRRG